MKQLILLLTIITVSSGSTFATHEPIRLLGRGPEIQAFVAGNTAGWYGRFRGRDIVKGMLSTSIYQTCLSSVGYYKNSRERWFKRTLAQSIAYGKAYTAGFFFYKLLEAVDHSL